MAELVSIMFAGDSETLPNKDNMLNHIRQGYKEFQKQPISDIALPKVLELMINMTLKSLLDKYISKKVHQYTIKHLWYTT